jgi:Family of unknown function (DUF5947)/AIR synthase related protein, C-terminal domain
MRYERRDVRMIGKLISFTRVRLFYTGLRVNLLVASQRRPNKPNPQEPDQVASPDYVQNQGLINTLRRFRERSSYQEKCEFCGAGLAPEHRHLLEVAKRRIVCTCSPCAFRFQDVVGGRFKLIPSEVRCLPEFDLTASEWENLALPINLAFFFYSTSQQKMNAMYPSPAGGGITIALTEIAHTAKVGIRLDESQIPISEEVKGACEILGLDPLYVANEGKLLAIVPAKSANSVLAALRKHRLGDKAAIIGEVVADHPEFVTMKTRVGGTRVVDMLSGEQLPRIC